MKKVTIETSEMNVISFKDICDKIANVYEWDKGYKVDEENEEVFFTKDGENFKGSMNGYDFDVFSIGEDGDEVYEELVEWLEALDADHAIRAKDEDGKDCFVLVF